MQGAVGMTLSLDDARTEMLRLSRLIDAGIEMSRDQAHALAEAENTYRKAKAQAWVRSDREMLAKEREAAVDAECADLRRDRDLAQAMRDAAREAVRARQTQLSSWQTLVKAHQAEAELVRTGPG